MPRNKILVVDRNLSYGAALEGLGDLTVNTVRFSNCPEDFSLVLFTGGADVDPSFYFDTSPEGRCWTNPERDVHEAQVYSFAVEHHIPCVGICRGLQLINVMNGGKMIHHLDGHEGSGSHEMYVTNRKFPFSANSLHHQMIIPSPYCHVLGWTKEKLSRQYFGQHDKPVVWRGPEIEAAYYPLTRSAGVQYHPEMMHEDTTAYRWFHRLAEDLTLLTRQQMVDKYVKRKELFEMAGGAQ